MFFLQAVEDVQTAPKGKFKDGMGAIYGMAESIPDRLSALKLSGNYPLNSGCEPMVPEHPWFRSHG